MSQVPKPNTLPAETDNSMQEYYQLQQELLVTTGVLTGIIFVFVWYFYSLSIALNYLLGAGTSVVYLKVLARNVEKLGKEKEQIGKSQLAIFVGLMIVATQLRQLHILPIFLGFLTYKGSLIVYMLRTLMPSNSG
ncbi:ATP synthase subunit I [Leptolyngbyaceae cyanobacterium UHCC 1019]